MSLKVKNSLKRLGLEERKKILKFRIEDNFGTETRKILDIAEQVMWGLAFRIAQNFFKKIKYSSGGHTHPLVPPHGSSTTKI